VVEAPADFRPAKISFPYLFQFWFHRHCGLLRIMICNNLPLWGYTASTKCSPVECALYLFMLHSLRPTYRTQVIAIGPNVPTFDKLNWMSFFTTAILRVRPQFIHGLREVKDCRPNELHDSFGLGCVAADHRGLPIVEVGDWSRCERAQ
jgi:hypothetical protein